MPKKIAFILIAALVLIIGSGCTKRQCVEADIPTFQAILDLPPDGSAVEDSVTFEWHHEEPCNPYRYRIYFHDPIEDHTLDLPVAHGKTEFNHGILGLLSSLHMDVVPLREYEWYVVAQSEADEGYQDVYGPESERFSFFYGVMCTPGELDPPELLEPEDGTWVTEVKQGQKVRLRWSSTWLAKDGECFSEEYQYQVASDPAFNHIVLEGQVLIEDWPRVDIPVPGCTHLYWRVRSSAGGSTSAWSEPYSFYYAADEFCWFLDSSDDATLIKGYVFEDKCTGSLPFESDSNTPPQGCVSSQYGIHADGIWDFTANQEPGIKNVMVSLGSSHCPEIGADEFSTLNNGMFYFTPKDPGEYCVSISKIVTPKLEEGIWTLPLTDHDVTHQTITIGPNDEEINLNFGWDKNDYKKMNYTAQVLTTCRQTDNKNSPAMMYLEEGSVIPVVATNEARTWFLTAYNCFVSTATGEAEEGDLPLYPEQPIIEIEDDSKPGLTPSTEKSCSEFTGPRSCVYPRCVWVEPAGMPGYCTESD